MTALHRPVIAIGLAFLFLATAVPPAAEAQDFVTVPEFANQPRAYAYRYLRRYEGGVLSVGEIIHEASDTIAEDYIIRSNPPAGAEVAVGSTIDLVVSSGFTNPIEVPDVTGIPQATATSGITDAGLVLGNVTEQYSTTLPAGYVISQDPQAGTTVGAGSAVDLVVSNATDVVIVPDVYEMTESVAENTLEDANLLLGTVNEGTSDAVQPGMIYGQLPQAGTTATAGSAVTIFVSTGFSSNVGPGQTLVPPLAGEPGNGATAEAAIALKLLAWNLTLGDVSFEANLHVDADDVIRTEPPAGTVVDEGTVVALIVSLGFEGDMPSDIDGDRSVNAVDIQLVINAALATPSGEHDTDVNNDGATDAVDVQLVINAALGGTQPPRDRT